MSTRPVPLSDSQLMAQHQDPGVLLPRLPARQSQQRHGTGHDEEDQVQAHKLEITARPGPDLLPARRRTRNRADGILQRICPSGAGFRHPQVSGNGRGAPGLLPGAAMRRPDVAGDVYGILRVAVGGFFWMVARALAVWTASLSASMS